MSVTTRYDARHLEERFPFPKTMDGKQKVFEEVFINSGGESTASAARNHLNAIRENHPASYGWYTQPDHEGVFQDTDGKWYAFRHHAKYR